MARKTQPDPKPTKPTKQPKNLRAPKPKHRWTQVGTVGNWSGAVVADTVVLRADERAAGTTKFERQR